VFQKTDKQTQAINAMKGIKNFACYGGSRSGKTFIIIYCLIIRASKCKSRHLVMRRTFNSVKRSIIMDTFPKVMAICFPNLSYKLNKTDWIVTLPNGSEIYFAGMDNNDAVEKILGTEFSTIYFNEASEIEYSPMQIVLSRLAEKNILKKRVFYDFNPPSKRHWSYWLFIKLQNPIDNEPLLNPDDYNYILMNPTDNIDNLDEEYIKLLQSMPEKERQRFLDGLFSDADKHVGDYPLVPNIPLILGTDFNVDPMTTCICQYYNGVFHIVDEVFLRNSDTTKLIDSLYKKGIRGATLIPDSTGRNRKTSGKSDFLLLKEAGFKIPDDVRNPFVTDRTNNVNLLLTQGRIKIDTRCKKLIGDLEKVAWKDNKLDQKTDKLLTHISDCLGYLTHYYAPLMEVYETEGIQIL